MKTLVIIGLFMVSVTVWGKTECIDKIEKLGKRSAVFKLVEESVNLEGVLPSIKEELDGGIFDVFVNQKCVNKEKGTKAVRVIFKAQTRSTIWDKTFINYCYSRVKKYAHKRSWELVQTICDRVENYNPYIYDGAPEIAIPYGGAEDPLHSHDGFFRPCADEIPDDAFPVYRGYRPNNPEGLGNPENPSSYHGSNSGNHGIDGTFDTAGGHIDFPINNGGPDGDRIDP